MSADIGTAPPLGPAERPYRPGPPVLVPVAVAGLVVAVGVLAAALTVGGGIEPRPAGDLPYPGLGTEWGLPVARLAADLLAMATVGFLVLAVALLPDRRGTLTPTAVRALTRARIAAGGWLAALAVEAVLNLSQSAGVAVSAILSPGLVQQYLTSVLEGQVALAGMVAALVVLTAPPVQRSNAAAALLGVAGLGVLLPPLLTGHSASASGHDLAMTSLAVHVGAAVLWVGGLAAVAWLALGNRPHLDVALPRFSRLAFGCFAAVLVSGVVNAAIRLGSVQALWQDHYGLLVLAKAAALVVLGLFGARHRNRSLAAVEAGSHRPFLRLAALELAVMAATVGLAVGLSKSPTPVARSVPDVSPAKAALGYELPGPISVDRLLDWGQPQLVFLLLVALGVLGYARGLMRVRADGSSWPVTRSGAWFAGLAVVAAATQSGLSRYGAVLFSVHVGQFVLLALVAPVLLVLGAPLTLALRTLRPAEAGRGARGWVVAAVRSPLLRLLTRPLVALAVLAVGSAGLFFTGLFDGLMREHAGHLAMELFFLAGGFLFAWAMVGPDPLPRRARLAERLPVLVASGALVAAFSIALRSSKAALGESWFGGLGRSWGPSLLADQHTGALVVLIGGEVAVLLMLLAALLSRSSVSAGGGTRTEVPERRSGREPSPVEG